MKRRRRHVGMREEREREKEEEMDNEIRRRGKKCSRDGVVKIFVKIFSKMFRVVKKGSSPTHTRWMFLHV